MRLIPVLDLLRGEVVQGMGGDRARYRPVESRWADSADPVVVARALCARTGEAAIYVADLDGILSGCPQVEQLSRLVGEGLQLHVDAGVRTPSDAARLLKLGVRMVIVGLETSPGRRTLQELVWEFGADRVMFSLDLMAGEPLVLPEADWPGERPAEIAAAALDCGVSDLLVLDLKRVGRSEGLSTLPLCRSLRRAFPRVNLWTGGGVRHEKDVREATDAGVHRLLVSTAVHNGSLPVPGSASDLDDLTRGTGQAGRNNL